MKSVIFFTTIFPILIKFIKYDIYDKHYTLYIDNESKKTIGIILMFYSLLLTFFTIINIRRKISLLKIYLFTNIINFTLSIFYIIYKKKQSATDISCIFIIILNIMWLFLENNKQ